MSATIISVNVGLPRQVHLPGGVVTTAIFKAPVEGRVALRRHNLAGDRQADLTVHGGPYKAVYLYAVEHYRYWAEELPDADLSWGAFGENLSTFGMLEKDVRIGDRYRAGSAVLQVTQPRMPCYKMNVRFERADMVKRFWRSGFSGIYFAVVEEGELGAGDSIEKIGSGPEDISVADVVRLMRGDETDAGKFERAMRAPLHGSWKEEIDARRRG